MSLRLHGRPLFVHAAQAAVQLAGRAVVVSAPRGGGRSVRAALEADGLTGVSVVEGGDTLGEVLTTLVRTGPRGRRATCVLVHDPRCPLVPASYLAEVAAAARADAGVVLAATRPMTDTVKSVVDGVVQATVDRTMLRVLSSPIAVPAGLLHDLVADDALAHCADVADLVELVQAAGARLRWVMAPGLARRVSDAAAVSVLECLTEVSPRSAG